MTDDAAYKNLTDWWLYHKIPLYQLVADCMPIGRRYRSIFYEDARCETTTEADEFLPQFIKAVQ